MRGIPDNLVHALFSWPTLPSVARRMTKANPNSIIAQRVHPEPPNQFVTLDLTKRAFQEKFGDWQNSMQVSPGEKQLNQFLQEVTPLVSEENYSPENDPAIRKLMEAFQGENKSHYVRPSLEELGKETLPKF